MSDVVTHRDVYELTKDVSHTYKTNPAQVGMFVIGKSVTK